MTADKIMAVILLVPLLGIIAVGLAELGIGALVTAYRVVLAFLGLLPYEYRILLLAAIVMFVCGIIVLVG